MLAPAFNPHISLITRLTVSPAVCIIHLQQRQHYHGSRFPCWLCYFARRHHKAIWPERTKSSRSSMHSALSAPLLVHSSLCHPATAPIESCNPIVSPSIAGGRNKYDGRSKALCWLTATFAPTTSDVESHRRAHRQTQMRDGDGDWSRRSKIHRGRRRRLSYSTTINRRKLDSPLQRRTEICHSPTSLI